MILSMTMVVTMEEIIPRITASRLRNTKPPAMMTTASTTREIWPIVRWGNSFLIAMTRKSVPPVEPPRR